MIGQPDFVSKGENQGLGAPIASSLDLPYGVAIDPASGKIFVADYSNHRVLRYPSTAAFSQGTDAEAVLGQQDFVSEVAGNGADGMTRPSGVEVDADGNLWVVEDGNNRVLLFEDAANIATGAAATGLLGAATFGANGVGNGAGDMRQPQHAEMGPDGTLWVADWQNHRILKFTDAVTKAKNNAADINNHLGLADGVLGQSGFGLDGVNQGDGAENPGASSLHAPYGLCLDPDGNLWVADSFNNRVVVFLDPGSKSNGANADGVIGSTDLTTFVGRTTQRGRFWTPRGITMTPSGDLWVCEEFNRRAMRFDNALELAIDNAADSMVNLTLADGILGQPDYTTASLLSPPTQDSLGNTRDIEISPYGVLWVCGNFNDRVMAFSPDSSAYQPDAAVGTKRSSLKGKNKYSGGGAGQKVTGKSAGGKKKIKFYGDVENDSEFRDDLMLTGTRSNRFFRAKYFRLTGGKTNITASVTKGKYDLVGIDGGKKESYLLEVKPKSKARGLNKKRVFKLTVTSGSGGPKEQGKFIAKTTK